MKTNKLEIVAEVAQAHDGSLGILHSFIDAAASCGVDAVKFQTHIAEAESSALEPFRVKFSLQDKTRYDYWNRMEFTMEQWEGIREHCVDAGVEFMSSPFSNAAVDLLEEVGIKRYKIGAGEVTNFLLLEKVARTGKPVILSSGMTNYEEMDAAVSFIKDYGNPVAVLQCTTAYPTAPADLGFNVIEEMRQRYRCPIGFSDHSGSIFPGIAAATLGAAIIEVHVTFDKRMFGPDARASLDFHELKQMVDGVRYLEEALNAPIDKHDNTRFKEVKSIFEKSLAVNKALKAGDVLTFEDLEGKKPAGQGISARNFKDVVGRKLKVDKERYAFLLDSDLE